MADMGRHGAKKAKRRLSGMEQINPMMLALNTMMQAQQHAQHGGQGSDSDDDSRDEEPSTAKAAAAGPGLSGGASAAAGGLAVAPAHTLTQKRRLLTALRDCSSLGRTCSSAKSRWTPTSTTRARSAGPTATFGSFRRPMIIIK